MKLSVNLPDETVMFLDEYAQRQGYKSRSEVVRRAVLMLLASELGAYEIAWNEWSTAPDVADREASTGTN